MKSDIIGSILEKVKQKINFTNFNLSLEEGVDVLIANCKDTKVLK